MSSQQLLGQADKGFKIVKISIRRINVLFSISNMQTGSMGKMSRLMIKQRIWYVRPAKTQISLDIRPV